MSFSFSGNINLSGKNNSDKSITSKRSTAALNGNTSAGGSSNKNSELSVGSKISGEIIKVENDIVLIALDNENVISAKLENAVNLALNSKMLFEISAAKDNRIFLRPLLTNTSQASMITEALKSAGIQADDKTMHMVSLMIDRGMSIDKQSLLQMNRHINEYPDTAVDKLLNMKQLNIPVNDINVAKFETYINMTHQLMGTMDEITDSFSFDVREMVANGQTEDAVNYIKAVLDAVKELFISRTAGNSSIVTNLSENGTLTTPGSTMSEVPVNENIQSSVNISDTNAQHTNMQDVNMTASPFVLESGLRESSATVIDNTVIDDESYVVAKMPVENNNSDNVFNGTLNAWTDAFLKEPSEEILSSISKDIKGILKEMWALDPKFYTEDGASFVKELNRIYESMLELSRKLSHDDINDIQNGGRLKETANELRNNISFLSDLNQNFTYMQIPLRLSDNYKNSELYVYSRKKSLATKEGELTAFLHLDMETLGPVDIKVSLFDGNVKTKFILKDEETIAFIEENMHFLNERLKKKGYSVVTEYEKMKKAFNVVNEMNEERNISAPQSLYQYSFDVRA